MTHGEDLAATVNRKQVAYYLKNWWHVISAVAVATWFSVWWISGVNAFMATGARLTPTMADTVYVRQDIYEIQQKEILKELRHMNIWFKYYAEQQGLEIPKEIFDE